MKNSIIFILLFFLLCHTTTNIIGQTSQTESEDYSIIVGVWKVDSIWSITNEKKSSGFVPLAPTKWFFSIVGAYSIENQFDVSGSYELIDNNLKLIAFDTIMEFTIIECTDKILRLNSTIIESEKMSMSLETKLIKESNFDKPQKSTNTNGYLIDPRLKEYVEKQEAKKKQRNRNIKFITFILLTAGIILLIAKKEQTKKKKTLDETSIKNDLDDHEINNNKEKPKIEKPKLKDFDSDKEDHSRFMPK